MASLTDLLRYLLNFTVFVITNCYGLFAYVMWAVLLFPLRVLFPSVYWKLETVLFKGLHSFVVLWMGTGRYKLIESGEDIGRLSEQGVLLMCNHQSTGDVPLVMMSLWGKGYASNNSMWVMDWVFRFTNFGLMSAIRRDIFIKQGKETRELQGVMLKDHLKNHYLPQNRKWIVLFPEGGFLYKRLESSQSYARKNNYPVLRNVTLPRIGALKAIIDTLGCPGQHDMTTDNMAEGYNDGGVDPERLMKWVVDMTIGYRNKEGSPPDMVGMCVGYRERQDIHVHYRAYPLSQVPRGNQELLKWVYDRYTEKEHLLDYFNKNGHFPTESSEGRVLPVLPEQQITYNWWKVALFQMFYIASAYVHYTCIIRPLMCLFW